MTNPFATVPTRGSGNYIKFQTPGESVTGTVTGTRIGRNFDNDRDVPEIMLNVAGEERILGCENAVLNNWAVNNGEAIAAAASSGGTLTVKFTGQDPQSRAKLYVCEIGAAAPAAAAPAPAPAAPQAAPVAAPTAPPSAIA